MIESGDSNTATATVTLNLSLEFLRPNAVGDATGIDTQSPATGAHWDKLDETDADEPGHLYIHLFDQLPAGSVQLTDHAGSGPINSVTVHYDVASVPDTTTFAISYLSNTDYRTREDGVGGRRRSDQYRNRFHLVRVRLGLRERPGHRSGFG